MTKTKTIERTTRTTKKIVPLVFKKKTIPITLMIKHKRRLILWTMIEPKTEKNENIELWSEEMYNSGKVGLHSMQKNGERGEGFQKPVKHINRRSDG